MSSIELEGIAKSWGDTVALHNVNLRIEPGSFCVLLGPSGCGKSTTLRIIAGLETATSGSLRIDGRDVTALPPAQRGVAMVFQNYALFPHLSVADNITFGLSVRRAPAAERAERLRETAAAARPGEAARAQAEPAVGRAAAARRARPRAGGTRQGLPDGRAAVQPRCAAAPGDAARAARAATSIAAHGGVRHARSGRGDEHGRSGGAAEPGPRGTERRAARALCEAGHHVCRALHRHAADEPDHPGGRPHRRQHGRHRLARCRHRGHPPGRHRARCRWRGRRCAQRRVPRRRSRACVRDRQPDCAGAHRRPASGRSRRAHRRSSGRRTTCTPSTRPGRRIH